jgi:hypothetical protein
MAYRAARRDDAPKRVRAAARDHFAAHRRASNRRPVDVVKRRASVAGCARIDRQRCRRGGLTDKKWQQKETLRRARSKKNETENRASDAPPAPIAARFLTRRRRTRDAPRAFNHARQNN